MSQYTDRHALIVCGQEDLVGNGEWTDCRCGVRIVHDPAMTERVKTAYPDREIVFLCYACATAVPSLELAIRKGLMGNDDSYEDWMRDEMMRAGERRIIEFLRKKAPQ